MSKQYRFETLQLHAGHTVDPTGANTICGATTPSWHLQQRRQHINGHFHLSQMPVIQQLNVCTLIVATKAYATASNRSRSVA